MVAPNSPNLANPNEQDQNADAAQGPTNQEQGPAEQNQAQVTLAQIPIQVPAAQIPIQGPEQIGQNIPVQPLQQPVPMQLAPCWYDSAHSPDNIPKLDREEARILW